ncbi:MAG: hypothetical protein PHR35_09385 [Kiritimatiellae bacterium]|nr:hypothetical protein [Kiritimatiellia bacterium]
MLPATSSPLFTGTIGATVAAADFPPANYLIDDACYDYEGNWAFCRFDQAEVMAARLGFGRGVFDWSDYGSTAPLDRNNLWVHLELMTRAGAVQWIGTGNYRAGQVQLQTDRLDCRLAGGGADVFHIRGWPEMTWEFASPDGSASARLRFRVGNVTILPDCIMPHNRFAMWLATARLEGEVRVNGVRTSVTGTAFHDHPRIVIEPHAVPPFGWYLYTPMQFEDGSRLAGYYSQDGAGQIVSDYCFGLYLDADGGANWLTASDVRALRFDTDRKPCEWESEWTGPDFRARLSMRVRPTDIRRAWGGPTVARTRLENGNMPLVFDTEGEIARRGRSLSVRGGGLAEYLSV